jgi:uncharacterized YccA/Bax inhibitor family protein
MAQKGLSSTDSKERGINLGAVSLVLVLIGLFAFFVLIRLLRFEDLFSSALIVVGVWGGFIVGVVACFRRKSRPLGCLSVMLVAIATLINFLATGRL